MVNIILKALLIAAVPSITLSVCFFLNELKDNMIIKYHLDSCKKYSDMAEDIIETYVIKFNQTIVNKLKETGEFTPSKGIEIFNECYNEVKKTISTTEMYFLETIYNDVDLWIKNKIEQKVNEHKG